MEWWQMQDEIEDAGLTIEFTHFEGTDQTMLRFPDSHCCHLNSAYSPEYVVRQAYEIFKSYERRGDVALSKRS